MHFRTEMTAKKNKKDSTTAATIRTRRSSACCTSWLTRRAWQWCRKTRTYTASGSNLVWAEWKSCLPTGRRICWQAGATTSRNWLKTVYKSNNLRPWAEMQRTRKGKSRLTLITSLFLQRNSSRMKRWRRAKLLWRASRRATAILRRSRPLTKSAWPKIKKSGL